jgi:hypothetical protein
MSQIEFKKISRYDFVIRHTANGGCIVQIGCCEVCFTTPGEMLEALADFYKDPEGMENKYNKFVRTSSNNPIATGHGATPTGHAEYMPDPNNSALRRSGPHTEEYVLLDNSREEPCQDEGKCQGGFHS